MVTNNTRDIEFAMFRDTICKLDLTLNGNGKPGLKADVATIQMDICYIKDNLKELTACVSELRESIIEARTEKTITKEYRLSARQKVALYISAIACFSGVLFGILTYIL